LSGGEEEEDEEEVFMREEEKLNFECNQHKSLTLSQKVH
jgi:hypothetical protein